MSKLIIFTILLTVFQTIKSHHLICFAMDKGEIQVQHNQTEQGMEDVLDTNQFTYRKLIHRTLADQDFEKCKYESHIPNCAFEFNLLNYINRTTQPVPINELSMSACFPCENEIVEELRLYIFKAQTGGCNIRLLNKAQGNYTLLPEWAITLI